MKSLYVSSLSVIILASLLGGCQSSDSVESTNDNQEQVNNEDQEESIPGTLTVVGLADHYHTGDTVELTATTEGDLDSNHWHWYTLPPGGDATNEEAWEDVLDNSTNTYSSTAEEDGQQVLVRLLDEEENVVSESQPLTIAIDDHHGHDDVTKRIYEGFFYYDEVEDRELSDYAGDWQSVYPYLIEGDLDEVMEVRAEKSDERNKEEMIEHYTSAYETDVDRVVITNDSFTFHYNDGKEVTAEYASDGYEILERDAGNRQVRFVYKRQDDTDEMPTYMIFSDHNINPTPAHHFHLYFGEDRDALLAERSHFPTYYPSSLDAAGVVRDMLAH
ncbi:ZinT/AdcA family metal-binding protein [Alkalihalobacillus sp. FSL W8-0930]